MHPAAIQFGDPAMLWWGLAAAVPILIHWLTRRRYREVVWAAMAFLLAAMEKHSRRLRLQQLLLLAIRVATLLLFAVALADVSCENSASRLAHKRDPKHTIIVLDGSFSMAFRSAGGQLFDEALDRAARLIEGSSGGDGFTLVILGDPPETVVATPVFDRAALVREVRSLELSHQRGDLAATLASIETILKNARQSAPQLRATRVCFITDLGHATWGEADAELVQQKLSKLAESVAFEWIDVGERQAENWAITGLRMSSRPSLHDQRVDLLAECRFFGQSQPGQRHAQWFVDGKQVEQQDIVLQAGNQVTLRLNHPLVAAGEHMVEVRLEDDALSIDNHRWVSIPIRQNRQILCVGGKPEAARFVSLALQPATSNQRLLRPELASELALLEKELSQYACIILCNVSRIDEQQAEILFDYVDAGGGVIIFLGDQVDASAYNEFLGGSDNPHRILPAEIGTTVSQANFGFDPLDYRHPIAQPFRGNEQAGLLTTPVWKYFQLLPYTDGRADIVLAFQHGSPAIVTEKISHGTSMLVATAASTASLDPTAEATSLWTAWPTWPSFPPLVHEMVSHATQAQADRRNVLVHQPFGASLAQGTGGTTVRIERPHGQQRLLRADGHGWMFQETSHAGVYAAHVEGMNSTPSRQWFAVNVDPRESDLARYSGNSLEKFSSRTASETREFGATHGSGRSWFRQLLVMVGVLLLLESFLAWHWNVGGAR